MQEIFIDVDGRKLQVWFAGSPKNNAILFHHGTPGSAKAWESWIDVVATAGGFAIAYSRPGYGSSERNHGRTVLENTVNTKAILEHFGIEKLVSVGWSGGGPHALADTMLPQSLAVISIAGVGEFGASDLDFLDGMGEENHIEFGAAMEGEAAIENWMQLYSSGTANVTGEQLIEALGGLIGDADKASLTPAVAERVASEFRHSLEHGYTGWLDDDLAFVQPWGFDIETVTQPVELWQGDEDFMVPHAHGYWLKSKLPNAKLKFVSGEGHISLAVNKRTEIISNALGYLS